MIKEIKFNEKSVLENLKLDFSKTDGSISSYNTVVLAGDNGTGKTTILELLASYLNVGSIEEFEYIRYLVNQNIYKIVPIDDSESQNGFHYRLNETDDNSSQEAIRCTKTINRNNLDMDLADLRHYGFSYSKARSGFKTQKVQSTKTEQIDSERYNDDSNDDYTAIKQLLVDLKMQDDNELARIAETNGSIPPADYVAFKQASKLYRFERAFNNFFDDLKFVGIDNSDSKEIQIIFEKFGKKISIDRLSTGEKQIVFRGAQLLRNANSISGGVVLVDEPELSMHPKWQSRILSFYRGLFNKNGIQDVQMIIATHSEYVLREALEDLDNTLIIVLKNENGIIHPRKIVAPSVLPTLTAAEINYLAFNIVSTDYHIQLYGYLQSQIKEDCTVKECDSYIAAQNTLFDPELHNYNSFHKLKNGQKITYQTLPTFIRNLIDHPKPDQCFTEKQLKISTELLVNLCTSRSEEKSCGNN